MKNEKKSLKTAARREREKWDQMIGERPLGELRGGSDSGTSLESLYVRSRESQKQNIKF